MAYKSPWIQIQSFQTSAKFTKKNFPREWEEIVKKFAPQKHHFKKSEMFKHSNIASENLFQN